MSNEWLMPVVYIWIGCAIGLVLTWGVLFAIWHRFFRR